MKLEWARRPSPALIVAIVALVAALAGTAGALPGKNTVGADDLKKNSVGGSEIKTGAVKSKEIDNEAVKSKDIRDGQVKAVDLAAPEAFRVVGEPGQPALSTGGDGDCVWEQSVTEVSPANPVAFYKDPLGVVHLVGATESENAAGGDTFCDHNQPGELEDAIVFVLPAGYRPENVTFGGTAGGSVFIVGDEDVTLAGQSLPAGAVFAADGAYANLDGTSFRAAGPGTEPISAQGRR